MRKDIPSMTEPGDTDDEIRPGDWALNRHDDNGEPGEVLDVLPFRGSMPLGGPDTFLYDVAVVRRGNRKTAERLSHLTKVAPP
jgi:hypothetical protein